jgi:hypothetical protein
MGFFKGKKKNWMIVLHKYHCGSHGFKHEAICGATKGEAEAYAAKEAELWKGYGRPDVAGIAIELPDVVQVVEQGH